MIWARARFLHALILARDVNVNALTLWRISLIRLQQRERAFINNVLNPDLSSSQPAPRSLFHSFKHWKIEELVFPLIGVEANRFRLNQFEEFVTFCSPSASVPVPASVL